MKVTLDQEAKLWGEIGRNELSRIVFLLPQLYIKFTSELFKNTASTVVAINPSYEPC
jgi:hypothetical protein